MKKFEHNGKQYVAVEVPGGSTDFHISNMDQKPHIKWVFFNRPFIGGIVGSAIQVGKGQYEVIGLVKDLVKEDQHGYNEELCNEHNLSDNHLIIERI